MENARRRADRPITAPQTMEMKEVHRSKVNVNYEPIVERVWGWTIGLLFASALVGCERSDVTVVVEAVLLVLPSTDVDVAEVEDVEDGFVALAGGLEDQELQVSQPSAERVDSRQQDQRLPLQRPA